MIVFSTVFPYIPTTRKLFLPLEKTFRLELLRLKFFNISLKKRYFQ